MLLLDVVRHVLVVLWLVGCCYVVARVLLGICWWYYGW